MRYFNNFNSKINYGNRGMILENDINETNNYYLINNIAIIYKKPTPIKILHLDYKTNKITNAFFETQSTLDYNGVYKGRYIEFDAKETTSKTSFPLSNIHNHQIKHIENIINNDGICFLIIRFVSLNKTYLLFGKDLINFIKNEERKSIPLSYFENNCKKVELKYSPRLDYIKIIKEYMEEKWKSFLKNLVFSILF